MQGECHGNIFIGNLNATIKTLQSLPQGTLKACIVSYIISKLLKKFAASKIYRILYILYQWWIQIVS